MICYKKVVKINNLKYKIIYYAKYCEGNYKLNYYKFNFKI